MQRIAVVKEGRDQHVKVKRIALAGVDPFTGLGDGVPPRGGVRLALSALGKRRLPAK